MQIRHSYIVCANKYSTTLGNVFSLYAFWQCLNIKMYLPSLFDDYLYGIFESLIEVELTISSILLKEEQFGFYLNGKISSNSN